ncbi:hypothetical protein D3C87_1356220 [compost metagenome]
MPAPPRSLHVQPDCRLARPSYPSSGLGAGGADDSLEHFRTVGGAGRQHRHRSPAPCPSTRCRCCRGQPVHLSGLGRGLSAHGHHRVRGSSRRAWRWRGVAADFVAGPAVGHGPGNCARRRWRAVERGRAALHAAVGGTGPDDPRIFPHAAVRSAGGTGQLCAGRLVPRHTKRPCSTGDSADHQSGQHRPEPMVCPRSGMGRGRCRPCLGDRRVDRCTDRPVDDSPRLARLPRPYRLERIAAVAELATAAGGQPRHLPAQPGPAIGVFPDHRARRAFG